jgi:methyl acetate hydrolase
VERISGLSLDEYMRKNIFIPCDAKSLTFFPSVENKKHRMTLCGRNDAGNVIPTTDGSFSRPAKVDFCSGGEGLYGTQKDYLSVLRAILQCDPKSGHRSSTPLLSPESFAELFSPSLPVDEGNNGPEYIAKMVSAGTYKPATSSNMNHSVGGILNLEDREGGRKRNSVSWAGMAKTEWWIDAITGIAVRPPNDIYW